MKLLTADIVNFGSYRQLTFDFRDPGLTLVYGPTGAGKSTLADIAPWVLYGVTAKDGNVDDVRNWQCPDTPTSGVLSVQVSPRLKLTVTRIRGKANENDLYWTENDGEGEYRGKDLQDTQRLLALRLGVSAELYLTGTYFHEFSGAGAFFTAKAKDRRTTFELLADLTLPTTLAEALTTAKRDTKKAISEASTQVVRLEATKEELTRSLHASKGQRVEWTSRRESRLATARSKAATFEEDREKRRLDLVSSENRFEELLSCEVRDAISHSEQLSADLENAEEIQAKLTKVTNKIEHLPKAKCSECGAPKNHKELDKLKDTQAALKQVVLENKALYAERLKVLADIEKLKSKENKYTQAIEQLKTETNTYLTEVSLIEQEENPFTHQIDTILTKVGDATMSLAMAQESLTYRQERLNALTTLSDTTDDLRGALLVQAVNYIEQSTNDSLLTHFDSEISVKFTLKSDSLDICIYKSGYECVYKQLSKGQRGLLKLCFATSVMALASQRASVHFSNLFMDEALDGLDTNLKVKAFSLFETMALQHGSILVIDHCLDLQEKFDSKILVTLNADCSELSYE